MKKIFVIAAFASLFSVASCQKEESNAIVESPVFTAYIDGGATKTSISIDADTKKGKISWESTDEITVKDNFENTAIYKIKSIDADGKAIFEIKAGETALGSGPYSATYGTEPSTSQTYSATSVNLYMTAPSTETGKFTFSAACGLMKINLTKTGESVKSVAVTDTTGGTTKTYTLRCNEAQNIDSGKDFYIALPEGSYTKIEVANASGLMCTLKTKADQPLALENNHIKPVTLDLSSVNFNALSGVFTVGKGPDDIAGTDDDVKVHFSRGNLTYNVSTTTWAFYEHQYDCATGYDSNLISLFTWGYGDWSTIPDGEGYQTGNFTDWGSQIGGGSTWRTLTTAEWQYLFNYGNYTSDVRNGKYKWATVNGVNGYVIAPDDFSGELANTYADDAALAANNLVFLPAAGSRVGSDVYLVGENGYYWSSTARGDDAYFVTLESSYVGPEYDGRDYGSSVRLITDEN